MRRRWKENRGQSFVEFAFIMPFLVFLVLGIVQFGRAWHNYLSITDAARVGAREAATHRTTACATASTKINSMGIIPAGSTTHRRNAQLRPHISPAPGLAARSAKNKPNVNPNSAPSVSPCTVEVASKALTDTPPSAPTKSPRSGSTRPSATVPV